MFNLNQNKTVNPVLINHTDTKVVIYYIGEINFTYVQT